MTKTIAIETLTIRFPFSESAHIDESAVYGSFADANLALRVASNFAPLNGCYDKTDFEIVVNGEKYTGRIDLQGDLEPSLERHIIEHLGWMVRNADWYKTNFGLEKAAAKLEAAQYWNGVLQACIRAELAEGTAPAAEVETTEDDKGQAGWAF